MNFTHKGYTVEIKSLTDDKRGEARLLGICQKTGWRINTYGGYDYLIERYKEDIDTYISKKEAEEKKMITPILHKHKGFILEIEEVKKEGEKTQYKGNCDLVKFHKGAYFVSDLIECFEIFIDTSVIVSCINPKKVEQDILKKTRGVFKYRTSCYFKDNTSNKNELVQVGYLDLDDNIVFNEPDEEYVSTPDKLIRYLPGFMVKGYRSCEEYIPKKESVETREVISENTIQYSHSTYSSSLRVTYSVIGFLGDNEELIYYNEIVDK